VVAMQTETNKLNVPFDAWLLVKEGKTELVKMELEPFYTIEPHINPVAVTFYCLSGSYTVVVDNEHHSLLPNSAIYVEPGKNRALINGKMPLQMLVIKTL
jgi:quercetin dioxygenase-like cupin family protein